MDKSIILNLCHGKIEIEREREGKRLPPKKHFQAKTEPTT